MIDPHMLSRMVYASVIMGVVLVTGSLSLVFRSRTGFLATATAFAFLLL